MYLQYERDDGAIIEISLTWNTDGVSPHNSSYFPLWPFYFVINELAPEERYKKENMIIGGLWGSHEKPNPNVFLRPLYNELDELCTNGINVKKEGSDAETQCRVTVLCGTCDSPAKSTLFNIKSHAGYTSCPRCLIEGEKLVRTEDVLVFPHQDVLELHTHENYMNSVHVAVETKEPSGGVKGASLLYFDNMFKSTSLDSMHCLYIGCLKQLLNLWFNPNFCKAAFSLSKKVNAVNRLMSSIRLPHFVERHFVPVDKLSNWKASLGRNVLLYILLPLLSKFMSEKYFNHTKLLVAAVGLLNSSSVSHRDLLVADILFQKFVSELQTLYGIRHMSFNIHLLRHLARSVLKNGPLCLTNCSQFEGLNGNILSLIHGTKHAGLEVCKNLNILSYHSK